MVSKTALYILLFLIDRLEEIYECIMSIGFEQTPDYEWIIAKFTDILSNMMSRRHFFDWQLSGNNQVSYSSQMLQQMRQMERAGS